MFPITMNDIRRIEREQLTWASDQMKTYVEFGSDDQYDYTSTAIDLARWLLDLGYDCPDHSALTSFAAFCYCEDDDSVSAAPFDIQGGACDGICPSIASIHDALWADMW